MLSEGEGLKRADAHKRRGSKRRMLSGEEAEREPCSVKERLEEGDAQ